VNITRVIHEFAKGDYSHRVRLRKGDYLQALARALNGMAETLASREKTLNETLRSRIRSAADEVRRSSSLERAQQILTDLQESIERILHESPSYSSLPVDEEPGHEAMSGEEHEDAMSGELSYK
jgi:nitrate/nitrite-specific signal transduction histidine kinase